MLYNTRVNHYSVIMASPFKFRPEAQVKVTEIIKIKATTDNKINKRLNTK